MDDPLHLQHPLVSSIRKLQDRIRDAVVTACETSEIDEMSAVHKEDEEGDTIYAVDKISEDVLLEFFNTEIAVHTPIILIAEGVGNVVLPKGTNPQDAIYQIIVDPIDGTRGLMYQKRSAWVLTGVALNNNNNNNNTTIQDIELAVQTEIPLIKQHLSDQLWAVRGQEGVEAIRYNRITQESYKLTLQPSRAKTIAHGFVSIARFFPGVREELSAIDEEIVRGALGPVQPGKTHCFEDQYISTAGQLYELVSGKDRFVADIRPIMEIILKRRGESLGICCHPYDICTELIARQLGVIITDEHGQPIRVPLDLDTDVTWVGYSNVHIQAQIQPLLKAALQSRGLLG